MALNASDLFDDILIGDEPVRRKSSHTRRSLENSDFLVGDFEETVLTSIGEKPAIPGRLVAPPALDTTPADFRSIDDLISEELEGSEEFHVVSTTPRSASKAAEKATSRNDRKAPRFERETATDLGEDFQESQAALALLRQVVPELEQFQEIQVFPTAEREPVLLRIREIQGLLREQQRILQDLISNFIRQGEFQRVASVDSVKRNLDEQLLQIRVLENRVTNRGQEIMAHAYVDGSTAEDIFREAEIDHSTLGKKKSAKKGNSKVGSSAFRRVKDRLSFSIPRPVRLGFLLLLLGLAPLAYHLSANWGVQPTRLVRVADFGKVIALQDAFGTKDAFHGTVEMTFKNLDRKQKEDAIRQLGAMLKVDGYRTIFLNYPDRSMAAIYSVERDQAVLQ